MIKQVKVFFIKGINKIYRESFKFYNKIFKLWAPNDIEFHYYGASYYLLKSLKLRMPAEIVCKHINWPHGWVPKHEIKANSIGRIYPAFESIDIPYYNFISTKLHEEFLREKGVSNVKAIGHPFIYSNFKKRKPVLNSLLVLPIHTSSGQSFSEVDFEKYVDEIDKIRHNYSVVDVMIHPNCIRQGYWINEFSKRKYRTFSGFEPSNMRTGSNLKKIFSKYEYMTTNGFGSHIVFAAYCGLKVSIYGTFATEDMEGLKQYIDIFPEYYKNNYYFIGEKRIVLRSEVDLKLNFPFLFKNPKNAILAVDWAKDELGFENKINSADFTKISNEIIWNLKATKI